MLTLEEIKDIDPTKLTGEQRARVEDLIAELRYRKLKFPILDFNPLPHQIEVRDAIAERKDNWLPKYKYILFIWGNWSAKTSGSVYIDILMALWKDTKKYWLPYIGSAKQILVVTKTSDLIRSNLEPYFLWTDDIWDIIKLPKEEIAKIKRDWATSALKEVLLKNWTKILFRTYDAGQARLEGSSPDFIHLDELPEREDIFIELLRWTRKETSQMLLSFTPTKFNPAVHNYFYWQESQEVRDKTFIREVDSFENIHADHTWLLWLTEEEREIRRFWKFIPPTGLVYKSFNKANNLVKINSLDDLWEDIKIYWALDFWVKHPMAFLFIAQNKDGAVAVFDLIYEQNLLLKDLVRKVEDVKKKWWFYNFEYIVADSADKRSRIELQELWMHTIPADKFSKWENNLSNRRAWIFKINWLFDNLWLFINDSPNLKPLIKEFETHAYKWNGSEDVIKESDDAIDALRYFIFWMEKKSELKTYKKQLKKSFKTKITKRY